MTGNVAEWCWDWYHAGIFPSGFDNSKYSERGGTGNRTRRGGSFNENRGERMEVAYNKDYSNEISLNTLGFRVARNSPLSGL